MPFSFERLEIPDVILVRPRKFEDARGYFCETYKRSEFVAGGIGADFVQDNQSWSSHGVIRGMHFQVDPVAQGKLVRCVVGEIFDVAVDIRPWSATFGRWVGARLRGDDFTLLYLPPGFAHGFQVVSTEGALVNYKCTAEYAKDHERGIMWNDPQLAIAWPVPNAVVSAKDQEFGTLAASSPLG